MENKSLQHLVLEAHAKAFNISLIHLTNNGHMINGLMNALKSINTTIYHNKIEIQRQNYAHTFLLTLADIDHRINQLCNGLQKFEADVVTTYNYIPTLWSKIVTPMLIDPIDLKTIHTNIQAVLLLYFSLPNEPNTNIWFFYTFLEIHP